MNLFNSAHAYADILVNARLLSDNEPHDNNAVHALNTRIHNNALCGLLYEGADFTIAENEKGRFIRIEYNNNMYEVPENAVKNILRGDFDRVVGNRGKKTEDSAEKSPGTDREDAHEKTESNAMVSEPLKNVNENQERTVQTELETQDEVSSEVNQEGTIEEIITDETAQGDVIPQKNSDVNDEADTKKAVEMSKKESSTETKSNDVGVDHHKPSVAKLSKAKKAKKKATAGRGVIDDEHAFSISSDLNHVTIYVKEEDIKNTETITTTDTAEEIQEETEPTQGFSAFVSMMNNEAEAGDDVEDDAIIARPDLNEKKRETFANKPTEAGTSGSDVQLQQGFFKKKVVTGTDNETAQVMDDVPDKKTIKPTGIGFLKKAADEKRAEMEVEEKKVDKKKPFFEFVPKKPKINTEKEEVVPGEIKIPKLELFDEVTEENHSNDNGELFNHIHKVVLRRRFGSAEEGPYRFVIWPTWIFDNTSGSSFAEILVHVTDPDDNEYVYVTQRHESDLNINVNNKTFKVYGTWNGGVFASHVVLTDKTASVYEAIDDVKKNVPKNISNIYLDQFRMEKRGYPSLFVVPFKNYNGGEEYIPIIGCVELNGARTVLPRRPQNELRYTFGGLERIVRGFWKNGEFTFTSEDANRMLLINEAG